MVSFNPFRGRQRQAVRTSWSHDGRLALASLPAHYAVSRVPKQVYEQGINAIERESLDGQVFLFLADPRAHSSEQVAESYQHTDNGLHSAYIASVLDTMRILATSLGHGVLPELAAQKKFMIIMPPYLSRTDVFQNAWSITTNGIGWLNDALRKPSEDQVATNLENLVRRASSNVDTPFPVLERIFGTHGYTANLY